MVKIDGKTIRTSNQINSYYRRQLYSSVDSKGLKEAHKCSVAHPWVDDGTNFLSGKDYIKCIHLRYGVLFSKSHSARGRIKDNSCRRGCGQPETVNHILQNCYATHFIRIKRHDNLVKYIQKITQDKGFTVHIEKQYTINNLTLKPDLTIYSIDRVHTVDIQVINDQYPLETAHLNKKEKYTVLKQQLDGLRPG